MDLCVSLCSCGEVGKNCVESNWKHLEIFEDRDNSFLFCLGVVYGCAQVCVHVYVELEVDVGCLPVFLDSFVLETGSQ